MLVYRQLRQTDYRFSHVMADARRSINVWGCLYFSLLALVESAVGQAFTAENKLHMYQRLVAQNKQNKYRGMTERCFVLDHNDVLAEGFRTAQSELRGRYMAIVYPDRSKADVVFSEDSFPGATVHKIHQWSVRGSNSHFRVAEGYDPYPQLALEKLLSERVYHVGK
jgi:hypothetical protein